MTSSHAYGPWTIHSRTERFRNEFIVVEEDVVTRPNGDPGLYATVAMKPGVAILPLDADGNVHLAQQFRYAVGCQTLEVPIGAIEAGEDPLTAARRELREEVGLEARQWTELGAVDMDTSIVRCPVQLFLATELQQKTTRQDATETIVSRVVPLDAALRDVMDGRITHAVSCVLILKGARYLYGVGLRLTAESDPQ